MENLSFQVKALDQALVEQMQINIKDKTQIAFLQNEITRLNDELTQIKRLQTTDDRLSQLG